METIASRKTKGWNMHKSGLVFNHNPIYFIGMRMSQVAKQEEFVDMTLVAEGHLVKVHKNLISLASPYIKNLIKSVPCTHPIIFLASITHNVLCQLLEYIYTGEVHVEIDKLNEFIKAAKELQLPTIANDLPHTTNLSKGQSTNTPEALPKKENNKIENRSFEYMPKNAATDSNNDILQTNIPSQNVNNNDLSFTTSGPGNINNATEDLLIPKIQILSNRKRKKFMPRNAATDSNNDILQTNIPSQNVNNNDLSFTTSGPGNINNNATEDLLIPKIRILSNRKRKKFMPRNAATDSNNDILQTNIPSQNVNNNDLSFTTSGPGNINNNATEDLLIPKIQILSNRKRKKFMPRNAATDSNNDILQTNIPSQNVNNNDLSFTSSGSGNINNNTSCNAKDLLIPKIQILSNRRTDSAPSDAAIKINANDIILDIDMAVSDNDNNDHSLPLATNLLNGQSTNTPEALPTVNKIQVLENRLLSNGMSEAATETNDMNNILVTKDTSSQNDVDNHDYSYSVVVTEIDDANNFEDLLKFPDPPNSTIVTKEHSMTDQQSQESEIIDNTSRNNEEENEAQLEFSLDLSINSLPQYTISNRGSLQLILNRYLYSMHYSANYGVKRRWRCIDYRVLHCKAFVDTLNDKIIKRKNCHVHPRHDSKIMNKIRANLIFGTLDRAEQETKKITSWSVQ